MLNKSHVKWLQMQSSCNIMLGSLLYFDILGDFIVFDDAASLVRLEEQCYPPALLNSAFWKVVEKGVCCPVAMCTGYIIS